MEYSCSEERFLSDVKDHKMTVLRDEGLDRHIRFRKEDTICYGFDLITWAGHLCVTGDCGTYVFSRIQDMFEFFPMKNGDFSKRSDKKLNINPCYWGEKLLSIAKNGGYEEFDQEAFEERVKQHFDDYCESKFPSTCLEEEKQNEEEEEYTPEEIKEEKEKKEALWAEIESEVLSRAGDGEHFAYQAVYEFNHDGFYFQDFFDGGGTQTYTFSYIWCLYSIVYGIEQYNKGKK